MQRLFVKSGVLSSDQTEPSPGLPNQLNELLFSLCKYNPLRFYEVLVIVFIRDLNNYLKIVFPLKELS